MFKFWAYILIGKDQIGKTTIQKIIWSNLCDNCSDNDLISDKKYPLKNDPNKSLFFSESSIQEKNEPENYIDFYYHKVFQPRTTSCILSSHADGGCDLQVEHLIRLLKRDAFNVCGIFFSNSWGANEMRIAGLSWDETRWIENPKLNSAESDIHSQLHRIGDKLSEVIHKRVIET